MDKRKALGRGLGALIPGLPRIVSPEEGAMGKTGQQAAAPAGSGTSQAATAQREFFLCPIEEIVPAADNPRQVYDEQRLQELADSIRAQGLVQPLVVRLRGQEDQKRAPGPASFVLIAGERRWRAAQRAGLKDVPVVVKDVNAARAFELALVENLQREDLNAIEEAEAYRRLSEEFGYTQEQLAQRVGRDRATVANALRLLKLPPPVRELVARDSLTMGHARALLGLEQEELITQVARKVLDKQLSVRQTEALVRREREEAAAGEIPEKKDGKPGKDARKPAESTPGGRDVQERLQKALGTGVRLVEKDTKSGRIEIDYSSLDELDRLLKRLIDGDLRS